MHIAHADGVELMVVGRVVVTDGCTGVYSRVGTPGGYMQGCTPHSWLVLAVLAFLLVLAVLAFLLVLAGPPCPGTSLLVRARPSLSGHVLF